MKEEYFLKKMLSSFQKAFTKLESSFVEVLEPKLPH